MILGLGLVVLGGMALYYTLTGADPLDALRRALTGAAPPSIGGGVGGSATTTTGPAPPTGPSGGTYTAPASGKGGGVTAPTRALNAILAVVATIPGLSAGGIGVSSGHVANSEHYYWNAADLSATVPIMDAAFAALLGLAKTGLLPIHCLIYKATIYSKEVGFAPRPYSGASAHYDHIHVSAWPSKGGGC